MKEEASSAILGTIEEMKFFLRTAYGDSNSFAGSTIHLKTQGLCQGSGAAPAGWAVVSIVLLDAHKSERHGAKFVCPISGVFHEQAAILFVDDTGRKSVEDTHEALQSSVNGWGQKLIASGGALKPSKCFYYLVDYEWLETGEWRYRRFDEEDLQRFAIRVPTPQGNNVEIEYLGVDDARKTLGSMTCPSGDCSQTLLRMAAQADTWVNKAKNGSLHWRDIWLLLY